MEKIDYPTLLGIVVNPSYKKPHTMELIELFDANLETEIIREIASGKYIMRSLEMFYEFKFQNSFSHDSVNENCFVCNVADLDLSRKGESPSKLIDFINMISIYQFSEEKLKYENVHNDATSIDKYRNKYLSIFNIARPKTPYLDEYITLANYSLRIEDFVRDVYMPYATAKYIDQKLKQASF